MKKNPEISQTSIAEKFDISFQLVHHKVKILSDSNYLYLEKDGNRRTVMIMTVTKREKEHRIISSLILTEKDLLTLDLIPNG